MIENLSSIKEQGIDAFLKGEEVKWRCPDCGGTICCHNGCCFDCGLERLRAKKQRYRWEEPYIPSGHAPHISIRLTTDTSRY